MQRTHDGLIFSPADFKLKRSETIKVRVVPCMCACNLIIVTSARGRSGRVKGMIHQQFIGGPKQVLVPPTYLPLA
jgi:hypothetical protein